MTTEANAFFEAHREDPLALKFYAAANSIPEEQYKHYLTPAANVASFAAGGSTTDNKSLVDIDGADAKYFTNIDPTTHLPVLNQTAIDKLLGYGNTLPYTKIQANAKNIGWDGQSNASRIVRGAEVLGLQYDGETGKYKGDFDKAAKQVGLDPTKYTFALTSNGTSKSTAVNPAALFAAVNERTKNLYAVSNIIKDNGDKYAAQPHATILFHSDGKGNLTPVINPTTGAPIAQYYNAPRMEYHQPWYKTLSPFLTFALPFVLPGVGATLTSALAETSLGAALGATGTQILSSALLSAGMAAITGGDVKKALIMGVATGALSNITSGAAKALIGESGIKELSSLTGIKEFRIERMLEAGLNTGIMSAATDPKNIGKNITASIVGNFTSEVAKNWIANNIKVDNVNTIAKAAGATLGVAATAVAQGKNIGDALRNNAGNIASDIAKDTTMAPGQIGNQTFPLNPDIGKNVDDLIIDADTSGDTKPPPGGTPFTPPINGPITAGHEAALHTSIPEGYRLATEKEIKDNHLLASTLDDGEVAYLIDDVIPEDPNQKPYDETDPDVDPDILGGEDTTTGLPVDQVNALNPTGTDPTTGPGAETDVIDDEEETDEEETDEEETDEEETDEDTDTTDEEDELNPDDIPDDPNAGVTDGEVDVDADTLEGNGDDDTLNPDDIPDDPNAGVTDGDPDVDADTLEGNGDPTKPPVVKPPVVKPPVVKPPVKPPVKPTANTGSNAMALLSLLQGQQQAPAQNITAPELAKIGYFYDVGGEDIFAPTQSKKEEKPDPYKQFYATGGTVDDLFRILRN